MKKILVAVVALTTVIWAGTALAVTPVQKCQQRKLKAQAKYQSCIKKNAARIIGGKADASADCQTKFSDALGKADTKATAAGTSCRYLDNGDGTVSDLNTGLVWEKKDTTCPGAHCDNDTFTWSMGTNNPDGTAFTSFLYGLNGGTSSDGTSTSGCFTGHCDWRLPTIEELAGIVDATQGNCGGGSGACIDPAFGPTQASGYWSATTVASLSSYAWDVLFFHGSPGTDFKPGTFFVRAVRGGL